MQVRTKLLLFSTDVNEFEIKIYAKLQSSS